MDEPSKRAKKLRDSADGDACKNHACSGDGRKAFKTTLYWLMVRFPS